MPFEKCFCFEIVQFHCVFIVRPGKVRKLVRRNQFQVKSTKIGTGGKFVTLQCHLSDRVNRFIRFVDHQYGIYSLLYDSFCGVV